MIYELDKSQFKKIRPLMKKYDAQNQVTLNAILEGNNRGKIYVMIKRRYLYDYT